MLVEDEEITRQINDNYVHWDDIQTRINNDPLIDFEDPVSEDGIVKEGKNFIPLISETDLNEENDILFRKSIIRKIQEQQIDSSNFYKYHEEQRVMKSFIPFIEEDKHSGDYAKSLRNKFQDFTQIPYFYPDLQDDDSIESDSFVDDLVSTSITHSLATSKVNLIKNAENEIEAIEIECNCGEKTRIELQFED
jgi:hypothetical protein